MQTPTIVWVGLGVGSTIGSFVPLLWGDANFLSYSSIFFSAVGAFAGIWVGYRLSQY